MQSTKVQERDSTRRLSVGAELQPGGGADVRVWAPTCTRVDLAIPGTDRTLAMEREASGHFHVFDPEARPGGRYWFRLDGDRFRADPASRFQPDGPHEPSAYVDPHAFRWSDTGWTGVGSTGHVLYEFHIGTFTQVFIPILSGLLLCLCQLRF